jgi:hypothetical protein
MPGAGVSNNLIGTRLTPREEYRTVSAADSDLDAIAEEIDTRLSESGGANVIGTGQTLALFLVLIGGATGATFELYIYGGDDLDEGSSSSSGAGSDAWCLVDSAFSITQDALKLFTDMPAGRYKVMVTSVTGGSGDTVIIKEQHSA